VPNGRSIASVIVEYTRRFYFSYDASLGIAARCCACL
jgi:hypothetical protein